MSNQVGVVQGAAAANSTGQSNHSAEYAKLVSPSPLEPGDK